MDIPGFVSQNPKSLYSYCIEYVASHIYMVDSLVGFPEIIGKEIFIKAATCTINNSIKDFSSFKKPNTRKSVQVFFEAYGSGDILQSLSLNKAHVFFNDISDDCWWIFEHLICLDLSSCGIGDDHDVLPLLEGLQRLETLVLKDNVLTSEGVRKLTLRSRMCRKSSSVLKYLDISNNTGITRRSINFLSCLPKLELLNVSNTSITFQETVSQDNWQACSRIDACDCITSSFLVRTEGWSAFLLEHWKQDYDVPKEVCFKSIHFTESLSPTADILVHRFYSRSKSRMVTKTSSSSISVNEIQKETRPLVLISHLFSCNHIQRETDLSSQTESRHVARKNPVIPRVLGQNFRPQPQRVCTDDRNLEESCTSRTKSTITKCDNETNLLNQYRCSPPTKKLKRASLLQQLEDYS